LRGRVRGARWTKFIFGDFAVAILIQFLQGITGFGDFVGVDDTVFIRGASWEA